MSNEMIDAASAFGQPPMSKLTPVSEPARSGSADAGDARHVDTLTEIRNLRARTRALAHGGVWFPVTLIAALLLLSIALYEAPFTQPAYLAARFPYWAGLPDTQRDVRLSYAFWFVLTPVTFALIAWWHRRRGRELGLTVSLKSFVATGLGALLALVALAALPPEQEVSNLDEISSAVHTVDWLQGIRTPILPLALALLVLAWAHRSVPLAATGLWIGLVACWFCAAGPAELPRWLVFVLNGFHGPALGGQLGFAGRPGPILIAMSLPLLAYAAVRGLRARR
jgi:hypothetical protein